MLTHRARRCTPHTHPQASLGNRQISCWRRQSNCNTPLRPGEQAVRRSRARSREALTRQVMGPRIVSHAAVESVHNCTRDVYRYESKNRVLGPVCVVGICTYAGAQ